MCFVLIFLTNKNGAELKLDPLLEVLMLVMAISRSTLWQLSIQSVVVVVVVVVDNFGRVVYTEFDNVLECTT